jgi:hypothetical protein
MLLSSICSPSDAIRPQHTSSLRLEVWGGGAIDGKSVCCQRSLNRRANISLLTAVARSNTASASHRFKIYDKWSLIEGRLSTRSR